jgi:hypothetical protein
MWESTVYIYALMLLFGPDLLTLDTTLQVVMQLPNTVG